MVFPPCTRTSAGHAQRPRAGYGACSAKRFSGPPAAEVPVLFRRPSGGLSFYAESGLFRGGLLSAFSSLPGSRRRHELTPTRNDGHPPHCAVERPQGGTA